MGGPRSVARRRLATLLPLHGRPEEKDVEVPSRQAPGDAFPRGAAGEHLPAVRLAEARPPRLPDVRHLQGPRNRAAPLPRVARRGPRRSRRAGRRSRAGRDRRGRARRCRRRHRGDLARARRPRHGRAPARRRRRRRDRDGREARRGRSREARLVARERRPRGRRRQRRRGPLGREHRRHARRRASAPPPRSPASSALRSPSRSRRAPASRS